MIDCGYHGNDKSADLYMAVFVHPPRQPSFTQKNEGGLKFFISNFATLSQRTALNRSYFQTCSRYFDAEKLTACKESIFILSESGLQTAVESTCIRAHDVKNDSETGENELI